jgi:hypothetical protein
VHLSCCVFTSRSCSLAPFPRVSPLSRQCYSIVLGYFICRVQHYLEPKIKKISAPAGALNKITKCRNVSAILIPVTSVCSNFRSQWPQFVRSGRTCEHDIYVLCTHDDVDTIFTFSSSRTTAAYLTCRKMGLNKLAFLPVYPCMDPTRCFLLLSSPRHLLDQWGDGQWETGKHYAAIN